jgi:phage protein D
MRRSYVQLTYDGTNITADIAPYLTGFTYTDVMSGEVDDISVDLQDTDELWLGDWLPDKGATLRASIVLEDWLYDGDTQVLPCGQFELDEIDLKSPPHTITIGAVSVPEKSKLRGVEKTRSWEKTTIKNVANELVQAVGMTLFYDTTADVKYDRVEQSDQSDLEFLEKCCKDAGLALKLTDSQVVIFEEYKYEQADAVVTVHNPRNGAVTQPEDIVAVQSWSFKSKLRDVYKACHVKHMDSKSKTNIEYTFTDPNKTTGQTLQVNQQVENIAEAERIAKSKLREKNKEEVTGSLSLVGDFRVAAGITITLSGFRKFDGKYIVTKVTHKVGGGYAQDVEIRRCLNGY